MPVSTLAIDAGQSGVRMALDHQGFSSSAEGAGVPRMDAHGTDAEAVGAALAATVDRLQSLPSSIDGIGVGLSGFELATDADLAVIARVLTDRVAAAHVVICTDGATSLLGALRGGTGTVVAAGTGTVAMSFDGTRWARVDGVGALLGDAGSGFWIGAAGLDCALRFGDGRCGSRMLATAAIERFGPLEQLPRAVNLCDAPVPAVAGFARDVAGAAAEGDTAARQILEAAGRELARSACAAANRRFGADRAVAISYAGEVFAAGPALFHSFVGELESLRPDARVVSPAGDSLAGAAWLVTDAHTPVPQDGVLWTSG